MKRQLDRVTLTRLASVSLFALLLAMVSPAAAQKPQRAVIVTNVSDIYSGPGEDYYVCDFLEEGAEIEIYDEVENGWLAIRPPHGSFSWVLADALIETDKPNLLEASRDQAPCFIGSRLDERRDAAHVRLMRGEVVQKLGSGQSLNAETGQVEKWTKIAPPAGEFRWIKADTAKLLSEMPETASTSSTTPEAKMNLSAGGWNKRSGDSPWSLDDPEPEPVRNSTVPVTPVAQQSAQIPVTASLPPGPLNHAKASAVAMIPGSMTVAAPATMPNFGGDFHASMQWLEAELTKTVSQPIDQWDFNSLKAAAQQLRYTGATPLERGEALVMVEKIEEFSQLQARKREASRIATTIPTDKPAATVASADMASDAEVKPSDIGTGVFVGNDDARYDGEGWLMPVIKRATSSRNSARYTPPFALTDEDGNVLQFVTPSPGVNLRRYLKQKVGLYGQVATTEEFTRPHLTASRVVVLSRHEKTSVETK
ncbi:SH3 domain-containing protein [Blastopirellula sp. JC732]|uniref:SH3 domain-containing protein n=1 Tax=Blastopirellula sediminis TaxID=2894196 RepID=A0A9X1SED1_9BACT|nr:SH3 domain-containing protein [Blastopirellula sediminis]MCC9609509.1 SH3 domain-containing protein [Blastopirellula sediminis]MCC9627715.1 SH3 domain-containing protein [Blastopirellula sediminis]